MRKNLFKVLAFVTTLLMLGCEQTFEFNNNQLKGSSDNERLKEQSLKPNWKEQLQRVIDAPPTLLEQSNISLLGYELLDEINDDMKVEKYKQEIIKDDNMMPYYTSSLKMVKAITKVEARSIRSGYQQFTLSNLEKYIKKTVNKNMKVIRLKWNNNGKPNNTLCLVSEQEGIIYDNFLTNTIIMKEPEISCYTTAINNEIGIPRVKTRQESDGEISGSDKIYRYTKSIRQPAEWLWGTECGYVEIVHSIVGYHNYMYNSEYNATGHMSVGSYKAEIEEVEVKKGEGGYSRCAYGYYMAAPGVNVKLSFGIGGYELDFSTSYGSSAGETGIFHLSSISFPSQDLASVK